VAQGAQKETAALQQSAAQPAAQFMKVQSHTLTKNCTHKLNPNNQPPSNMKITPQAMCPRPHATTKLHEEHHSTPRPPILLLIIITTTTTPIPTQAANGLQTPIA
jgi:hypothetical protein